MDNPAGDLVGACHICGREIRAHFEPGFGSIVVIRAARTAAERHHGRTPLPSGPEPSCATLSMTTQ